MDMRWMIFAATTCLLLVAGAGTANAAALVEWRFETPDAAEGWTANHMTAPQVANGTLRARATGKDPFLVSPLIELTTDSRQRITVRMSSTQSGLAQFFWAPTTEDPYGGFRTGLEIGFQVIGDGEMHDYTVYPFWQASPRIVKIRLDVPGDAEVAIERIAIESLGEGVRTAEPDWNFKQARALLGWVTVNADPPVMWRGTALRARLGPGAMLISPAVDIPPERAVWATVVMKASGTVAAEIGIASDRRHGLQRQGFAVRDDGEWHTYNVCLAKGQGEERIVAVALSPASATEAELVVRSIAIGPRRGGPADLLIKHAGLARAINRVGKRATVTCTVLNTGGEIARNVVADLINRDPIWRVEPEGPVWFDGPPVDIPPGARHQWSWDLVAGGPIAATVTITVTFHRPSPIPGMPRGPWQYLEAEVPIRFTEPVDAAPSIIDGQPYVPEPKPVRGETEVGVYYFPGWAAASQWAPIRRYGKPIPVLGYYAEGSPEVADWHIKWAVEHGITFFIYDWYWVQGSRMLEHGLHDGYLKSRYRKYLNFCLLWANHNPPDTSSEADLLAVTDYWIDHYFNQPEYQTVDGKPMVVIFAPDRLTLDMGAEAVRVGFDKMRARCRERGLKGLYLVACTGPDRGRLDTLAAEGYDALTAYNYPRANLGEGHRSPYERMIEGYRDIWEQVRDWGKLPYIVPASPGWDSRPWHGEKAVVRTDPTPELFERHLREAQAFIADRPADVPDMVIIEAWNEWGEGSYIEPNAEFGFGHLDAIRSVFTDAPREHDDVTPEDVGLGPYDVPEPAPQDAWEFDREGDLEGWRGGMGLGEVSVADGVLRARATSHDPAFAGPPLAIRSEDYRRVMVRMKTDRPGTAQLFWACDCGPISEPNSERVELVGDGQWHEYTFAVGDSPRWQGRIEHFRFDPQTTRGAMIEIDWIRLVR